MRTCKILFHPAFADFEYTIAFFFYIHVLILHIDEKKWSENVLTFFMPFDSEDNFFYKF